MIATRLTQAIHILILICAVTVSGSVKADEASEDIKYADQNEQYEDEYGVTNPDELSMNYYIKNMDRNLNRGHDFVCSLGYFATKSGNHKDALKIFRTCSERGNNGTKIWMSYMHQNGYGVKKDAAESTRWVKDAADNGYSIGKYNYGLALLKGYGVKRDLEEGKKIIDQVAAEGDIHAKELQKSNYNPDVVTPDADQADTQPLF